MRVKTNFLCAAALCAVAVMAAETKAVIVSWSGGDGAYNVAANWDSGIVPISDDQMFIGNGSTVTLNDAQPLDLKNFRVNNNSTLVIEPGAEIGSTGWSFIGKSGSSGGTINMSGGLIKIDSGDPATLRSFMVGHANDGTLNMSGGLLSATGEFRVGTNPGTGIVNLSGGMVEASGLLMGPGTALIDVSGSGIVKITDPAGVDLTSAFQDFVNSGLITGNGSAAGVALAFDPTSGITSISAIPEPTSIVLLGLAGSLLAIRRRR